MVIIGHQIMYDVFDWHTVYSSIQMELREITHHHDPGMLYS